MVAPRKVKIYRGQTQVEELQEAFRDEMRDIMKDAALKMGCSVELLMYRVDNMGKVEVRKMTEEQYIESEKQRKIFLRKKEIRRIKGMDNG